MLKKEQMMLEIRKAKNPIGANIIEVSTCHTKIILDVGTHYVQTNSSEGNERILDYNDYDAVFINHYNTDYMALAYNSYKDLFKYISQTAYEIVCAANKFRNKTTDSRMAFLKPSQAIELKDIKITPYYLDSGEYVLHIKCGKENVVYCGDFSINRRLKKSIFDILPQNIDLLICSGINNFSKSDFFEDERALQRRAKRLFKKVEGPIFVLQSSTNINRIRSMYKAAKANNRIFLQELYMAEITKAIGKCVPNPNDFPDVKVFVTRIYENYRYGLFKAYKTQSKISKSAISKAKFVMCIRMSMYNYIKSLLNTMNNSKGLLINSFTGEYANIGSFLDNCRKMGLTIVNLQTTENVENQMKRLLKHTNPAKILPINNSNTSWFERAKHDLGIKYQIIY